MDDPVKIIFKCKNNNRRVQYYMYIFVGNAPKNIMKILKKIQDKQLYESLLTLSNEDIDKLEKFYGEFWYNKFFNTYHVNFSVDLMRKNKGQQSEIVKKMGKNWWEKHVVEHKLVDLKLYYSYEALIREEILKKEEKRRRIKEEDDEADLDYRTVKKIGVKDINRDLDRDVSRLLIESEIQSESQYDENQVDIENEIEAEGGYGVEHWQTLNKMKKYYDNQHELVHFTYGNIGIQNGGENKDDGGDDTDYNLQKLADTDKDSEIEFDEGLDQDIVLQDEDNIDIEELEKIYQDTDVIKDADTNKTSNLIQMALKDEELFKKLESNLVEFDTSKDNLMFDESLKNVIYKNYITTQYIFKDDTIKTVKSKICASIKNNPKFEKNAYIVPSRQYLWSEYFYKDQLEKVMIGQKWIKKTEMMPIDVEPNTNMRIYEELRGNLKSLRDNIRRYGSKIKWEDDDFNILYDYEGYYNNNEIYMIDIYNELGKDYAPDQESLKNLIDVYIRIYFRKIKTEDMKYIIDYVGGKTQIESGKIRTIFETINNDLVIENQIMQEVELTKKERKFGYLFKENYITQSVIHVGLRTLNKSKINLFRIFNEFVVNEKYPFIQYQTLDGLIIFKYSDKDIGDFSANKENIEVLSKWFENAPYGISFKVKIEERDTEKFMAINLSDTGRVEYKTQWKETDMATIDDIKRTYWYVYELIDKLNSEKNKVTFDKPHAAEFKYAFINTIQKFELPEKFVVNHNELSDFARFFYPYAALVTEPRKRQPKIKKESGKSKFGSYLRYKRVSKYENQARIEQRILYFMRNYDYNIQTLASEISKQFNITLENALENIERVIAKWPNIKKSRKVLKKLDNIPKYKPPGIGIDIQGRQTDKYKIRISGARNKDQLDRILTFINILIYLYVETYLYKRPERQALKEKLANLTKIAKRMHKVQDVEMHNDDRNTVKQMELLDKKRLGFRPEKGQNQWTRSCQNSGDDKKRRPQQTLNLEDLLKQGFRLNEENGIYEKTVTVKGKGGKKKEVLIRAVGLDTSDDDGNPVGTIYYSCNPEDNTDHMFIGFLSRSKNPYGQCMPCCFKKDPLISKNKDKRDYYMKCIGKIEKFEKTIVKPSGDKLYILQDTNKIQEGKFGFLPKYLDYFLNKMLGRSRKIQQHYLVSSDTGYFFKYGSKQDNQSFLNAIASVFDIGLDELKKILIDKLEKDKGDMLFTSLNNGDIRASFGSRDKYIEYIKGNVTISFDSINALMCLPGVLKGGGINIVVFKKETLVIKGTLEKEKIRDDFIVVCQNSEEIDNLKNEDRLSIIVFKDAKNYYPIVSIRKEDEQSKNFDIDKFFRFEDKKGNVMRHVYDFYVRNCRVGVIGKSSEKIIAKKMVEILAELENRKWGPVGQVVDVRGKCKYILVENGLIIPVKPSGSIYNLKIFWKLDEAKLKGIKENLKGLDELSKLRAGLKVKPVIGYYNLINNDGLRIIGIGTEGGDFVPVKPEIIKKEEIERFGLNVEYRQLFDKVDAELSSGKKHFVVDERILKVNLNKFENESYELFRLHLSEYLKNGEGVVLGKKIEKIIDDPEKKKGEKKNIVRGLLFKAIDKRIFELYSEGGIDWTEQEKGDNSQNYVGTVDRRELHDEQKGGRLMQIVNEIPDLTKYEVNNNREICGVYDTKEKCLENKYHCSWSRDSCNFSLTKEMLIVFVNKVSEELASNDHKAFEILQKGNYFVSDIVDYTKYTEREGQKIIKSTNNTINKVLNEIFGKDNVPKIGKRRNMRTSIDDLQDIHAQNPLVNMGEYYVQKVIEGNLTVFRAFANSYSWIKHIYYDIESRNLGYYSNLQTDMANYFRSNVIDWIMNKKNSDIVKKELIDYMNTDKKNYIGNFINKISKDVSSNTNGLVELFILNNIYDIPIVIYDKYNTVMYVIDNGFVYDSSRNKNDNVLKKYSDISKLVNYIVIRFSIISVTDIPLSIDVLYYR